MAKRTKAGTAQKSHWQSARYVEAVAMYQRGLSTQDVAKFYGISRQAMWDILVRRGARMRPKVMAGEANRFHRGGARASDRAQNALETAIQRGLIQRRTDCQDCGASPRFKDGRSGIQAHHPDYNKPLEVMWLCQPCHHAWHKANRAIPLEGR